MEFHLRNQSSSYYFDSFEGNTVIVSGTCYTTSLIIAPDNIIPEWQPKHVERLTIDDLQMILDLKPEVAIVGTGVRQQFPDSKLLKRFMEAKVGIDFMDTHAACRTYNVLAADGRYIVAGIILDSMTTVD